jgi:hypothetical protein
MKQFKLFEVENEFIVAETKEQAVEYHLNNFTDWTEWYGSKEEVFVREVPLDEKGHFETENGWKEMTFAEFLSDFEYTEPQTVCWREF